MGERTETDPSPTPAIVRPVDRDKDGRIRTPKFGKQPDKIINQPAHTISHSRGFGDSGYVVQTVEHECPECGFDRMVRRVDVSPERKNEVRYWCLNPNCVHFVRDELSHACKGSYPQRTVEEPKIFEG